MKGTCNGKGCGRGKGYAKGKGQSMKGAGKKMSGKFGGFQVGAPGESKGWVRRGEESGKDNAGDAAE